MRATEFLLDEVDIFEFSMMQLKSDDRSTNGKCGIANASQKHHMPVSDRMTIQAILTEPGSGHVMQGNDETSLSTNVQSQCSMHSKNYSQAKAKMKRREHTLRKIKLSVS